MGRTVLSWRSSTLQLRKAVPPSWTVTLAWPDGSSKRGRRSAKLMAISWERTPASSACWWDSPPSWSVPLPSATASDVDATDKGRARISTGCSCPVPLMSDGITSADASPPVSTSDRICKERKKERKKIETTEVFPKRKEKCSVSFKLTRVIVIREWAIAKEISVLLAAHCSSIFFSFFSQNFRFIRCNT